MTDAGNAPTKNHRLRVVILEDNLILAERFKKVLSSWDCVVSIDSFADNATFIEHISNNHVDVLLADLNLNDGQSFSSISTYSQKQPNGISIAISIMSDGQTILDAISAGAVGYIYKNDTSIEIIQSIEMALEGKAPISSSLARTMITRIHNDQQNKISVAPEVSASLKTPNQILTDREIEVLKLIAKGLTNSECAQVLGVSPQTIPVHARNIFKKLHTNNRSEAVYEARTLGVID